MDHSHHKRRLWAMFRSKSSQNSNSDSSDLASNDAEAIRSHINPPLSASTAGGTKCVAFNEVWKLSEEEKELVRRTWSDDFNFLYELGAAIYTYIFEHNPHTRQLFPKIHRHGEEGWRDSAEFRLQALRFAQTLAFAVHSIYDTTVIGRQLATIGEHHVRYIGLGFKPEYWDIFQDAIHSALGNHIKAVQGLDEGQKEEAEQVWGRMATFMVANMKMGFDNQRLIAYERTNSDL